MADNRYTFFDPNNGEERNLNLDQLSDRIDEELEKHRGTDLFFLKGETFNKKTQVVLRSFYSAPFRAF